MTMETIISLQMPEWLKSRKEKAQQQYNALQWPNFRYGLTMRMDYSDLNTDILEQQLSKQTEQQIEYESTGEDGIIVTSLQEAMQKYQHLIEPYLLKIMSAEHKFATLHKMLCSNGTFIYIHGQADEPIIIRRKAMDTSTHHTLIVADDAASATIIELLDAPQQQSQLFVSNATEIIAKTNASVRFISVQNYPQNVFHFDYKDAEVDQDAQVHWVDCCMGSTFTQSTIHSLLNGIGSESTIKNMFFGSNSQRLDLGAQIIHGASHTRGDIVTRGVLKDNAKNIYRGLIRIERDAPSSSGYQKEDVLMLSEHAEADSIPQLEIDNNDVKCSHAATTTHVDKERLFYLMARGLSEKAATELFVQGFLEPFLQQLHAPEIIEQLQKQVQQRLQ